LKFRDRRRYSGERKRNSPEAAAAAARKREGKLENIIGDGVTVVVVVEHRALRNRAQRSDEKESSIRAGLRENSRKKKGASVRVEGAPKAVSNGAGGLS
jgi:hypothetical protein